MGSARAVDARPGSVGHEGPAVMDALREMARAPVAIFERFLVELHRVAQGRDRAAPASVERVKELQAATVRDITENLQEFGTKAQEAEAALRGILRPPRADLHEEIQRAVQHVQRLLDLAAHRDRLLRLLEDQPADAIVEGYRAALERDERERAELYEAEAEGLLRRRADPAALQTFTDLRARAEESRLSPTQQQARVHLEEIERLTQQVTLAAQILTSALQAPGGVPALGANRRKASRLRLDGQASLPALILPGPHAGMTASVVDVSPEGLRLALPQALPPGGLLDLVVRHAEGGDGEVRIRGELRWCRADASTPGGFVAGVRLVSQDGGDWVALLPRLAEAQRRGAPAAEARRPAHRGTGAGG